MCFTWVCAGYVLQGICVEEQIIFLELHMFRKYIENKADCNTLKFSTIWAKRGVSKVTVIIFRCPKDVNNKNKIPTFFGVKSSILRFVIK